MNNKQKKIYFVVAVIEKVLNDKITIEKFFKVFEFTKGKVYYELLDENDLELYDKPILSISEDPFILDSAEKAIKQLEGYRPQLENTKKEKLKETLESEIKRLSEKYKVKGDLSKID